MVVARIFFSQPFYLLVVGELDGLDLLCAILVVVEVVLDGERLEQLHGGLGAHLGHPIEEEHILGGLPRVVQLVRVQLCVMYVDTSILFSF